MPETSGEKRKTLGAQNKGSALTTALYVPDIKFALWISLCRKYGL